MEGRKIMAESSLLTIAINYVAENNIIKNNNEKNLKKNYSIMGDRTNVGIPLFNEPTPVEMIEFKKYS